MSAHDLINSEPWVSEAACGGIVDPYSDPETFFPVIGPPFTPQRARDAVNAARAVCARCTVTTECLAYALEQDERHGVWGGRSEDERRRMKRRIDPMRKMPRDL